MHTAASLPILSPMGYRDLRNKCLHAARRTVSLPSLLLAFSLCTEVVKSISFAHVPCLLGDIQHHHGIISYTASRREDAYKEANSRNSQTHSLVPRSQMLCSAVHRCSTQ